MENRMSRRFSALFLPAMLVALSICVAIGFTDLFKNKEVLADGEDDPEYVLTVENPVVMDIGPSSSSGWYSSTDASFTPSETAYYEFALAYNPTDVSPVAYLYNFDEGFRESLRVSYTMIYKMKANVTYTISIESGYSAGTTATVSVAKYNPVTSGKCGEDLTWNYDLATDVLTISGTGDMYDYASSAYDDNPLPPWFILTKNIKSVIIENGVESVGSHAFASCKSLETVTIGKDVKSLGYYSFQYCENMTSFTFAENSSLTTIGTYAFGVCKNLESFSIPSTVKKIGNNAFSSCAKLSGIVIPKDIEILGEAVFSGCSSLTEIVIPYGITSIDNSMFSCCSKLTDVTIPETVTKIANKAFSECSSLETITLPSGLTSIDYSAFEECYNLQSIDIPEGVTYIGDSAFYGCSSLASVEIPQGVTVILDGTFCKCSKLTSVSIPDSVTRIGENAFQDCELLSDIVLPSALEEIGYNAFSCCDSITSVSFGKNLTTIGADAFSSCYGLQEVFIPKNVKTIGYRAFNNCNALKKVTIEGGYLEGDTFEYDENLETVILGDAVVYIGDEAFLQCRKLKSIFIPGSVGTIGESAFKECTSLQDLTIEEGVKNIGSYAFQECGELTTLTIPASITSIGIEAFKDCSGITDVYCYAYPDKLSWYGANNDFIPYSGGSYGYTECHVFESQLEAYRLHFGYGYIDPNYAVNVTFVGDLSENVGMGEDLGVHPYGYTLSIDEGIGVNFYMALSGTELSSDAYVKFTVPNGNKTEIQKVYVQAKAGENRTVANTVTKEGKEYYVFSCKVAPKEIFSTVRAQMIDGTRSGEKYSFSVRSYAEYILSHTEDNPEYAKAEDLVRTMLLYGNYARFYFTLAIDYNYTDDNAIFAVNGAEVEAAAPDTDVSLDPLSGVTFAGSTLSLESETTLSLYFRSSEELTFSCDKSNVLVTTEVRGYKVVRIRGIAAAKLNEAFTITVSCNGTKVGTVTFSPMNYISYVINNNVGDNELQCVVKALYLYYKAAKAYV